MPLPEPPRTKREKRRRFLESCLDERPDGGYITDKGARLLWKAVRAVQKQLPKEQRRKTKDVAREALLTIPVRRVTRRALERFRLIPRRLTEPQLYSVAAAGHEYGYRELLDERIEDGEPQVLVGWEPTWEPVANIRRDDLRKLHNIARDNRLAARNTTN